MIPGAADEPDDLLTAQGTVSRSAGFAAGAQDHHDDLGALF